MVVLETGDRPLLGRPTSLPLRYDVAVSEGRGRRGGD